MSYQQTCKKCGKPYTTIYPAKVEDLCFSCQKKKYLQEKIDWLADRRYDSINDRPRTLEERIAWIEEWILNQEKPQKGSSKGTPIF